MVGDVTADLSSGGCGVWFNAAAWSYASHKKSAADSGVKVPSQRTKTSMKLKGLRMRCKVTKLFTNSKPSECKLTMDTYTADISRWIIHRL